jgi:hypothetical protein
MPIQDEILKLVPIGEANAVSSRLLWQQLDKWAASSVRGELHKMATRGLIQSKTERQGKNEVRVFFKRRGQDD